MNPAPKEDASAHLLSSACSVEILIHRALLSIVFLPFAFLVFPFLTFHVTISLLNLNLSDDLSRWRGIPDSQKSVLFSDSWEIALAISFVLLIALLSALRYWRRLRQLEADVSAERRYREPKGEGGRALRKRIEDLWSQVGLRSTGPPAAYWFPNSSVLAQAIVRSGRREIAVSTGLWEQIEAGDSIADAVLLHEFAHLFYGDPLTFRRMTALLESAVGCLALLFRVLALTAALLLVQQVVLAYHDRAQLGFALRQGVVVAGIGTLALSLCPVTAAAIRRYIGFIVALIELRADVRAAQWAGGLEQFVGVLSLNSMVHKSTLTDRARSLFSLDLTHFSETERLEMLHRPERLITPKVQYFGFSLLLVLLLPLNGLTPLFEGGILDWAAVATVAVALMVASTAMLTLGCKVRGRISSLRLLALSACATLFCAACQMNLYTFAYSLSTAAVEVGLGRPSLSENGSSLSIANFISVMSYPLGDIRHQLYNLWSSGWVSLSILITMAAFTALLAGASNGQPFGRLRWLTPAVVSVASGFGVLLDAYDPWRSFVIEQTLVGRAAVGWAAISHRFPGARFTLGPCLAVSGLLLLRTIGLITKLSQPDCGRPEIGAD